MQFSSFQKITSFLLLFSLLFSFTIRVPFLAFFSSQTYAAEEPFYNLVSIIVDEEVYSDVKSKLVRYSQDIQGVLENTRVVILPTPTTATSFDIASLNEKLYYEGYKGVKDVNFESKLVGTLLVGDIPVPVVFDNENASRTLLPYIDFEDKSYIYNHDGEKYELDIDAPTSLLPEIWHGVISPNSGDDSTDIDLIEGYFDKNHDFYKGEGNFREEEGIINGNELDDVPAGYEPYVFYYDQFRETQALSYEKYQGYQAYLQNMEDITYNRYTRELAEKVKDQVLGIQNENLKDLVEKAIPGFPIDGFSDGPDIEYTPDVQTRYITDNATNKFLEIFNEGTLADIRKYVHNAGRYNGQGSQVNVDMAPFLISVLDQVSAQVVKNVNTELEGQVDSIVTGGLSRNIAIPLGDNSGPGGGGGGEPSGGSWGGVCGARYANFYYGKLASEIQTAADCSINRGSLEGGGKLVEGNRGLNINLIQSDLNLCGAQTQTNGSGKVTHGIWGYWGGNTPVNLLKDSLGSNQFELDTHNLHGAIRPIFDIVGTTQLSDASRAPSPLDCYDGKMIRIGEYRSYRYQETRDGPEIPPSCELYISLPVLGQSAKRWNCSTSNTYKDADSTFEINYIEVAAAEAQASGAGERTCPSRVVNLSGQAVIQYNTKQSCFGGVLGESSFQDEVCSCGGATTYNYKKIPSHIQHISPTGEEFGKQIQGLISPALPVDKDRYIDFIAANGDYAKINYPYLFRVTPDEGQEFTLENTDAALKKHLDEVSTVINTAITNSDPSRLSGNQLSIYNLLKTGNYPSANVDLYNNLKSRPLQTFTIEGNEKEISYYDTLVFAIYWNNLKTVSGKYKFIFENYLSDQFGGNDFLFNLPKNKKSYEVAYLGAPGDSQNMYIKLDPKEKGNNPYASVIAKNIALNTSLLSANVVGGTSGKDGTFECAPPDGVPIWEWIPAVVCRLQSILPPTIGISEGACGPALLTEEEKEELHSCQGDVNKNGISDCIEGKLDGGKIELVSDASKYHYNKTGMLGAIIRDKNNAVVTLDSISYVDFELLKLEIPAHSDREFDEANIKVIYDSQDPNYNSDEDFATAQRYVNFRGSRTRVTQGKAVSYFSTKRSDINAEFTASLTARDNNDNAEIFLESTPLAVKVRGDRLFLNSYSIEGTTPTDISPAVSTLKVSGAETLFLIDTNQKSVEDVVPEIYELNGESEKVILALTNFSKQGNVLPLTYPLSIKIEKDETVIYEESDISLSDLENYKPLGAIQTSGALDFIVTDASGYQANKTIDFTPDIPTQLDVQLGTTVSQTDGNITTHIVTFLDRFNNVASGDIYTLEMEIDGGGLTFQDTGSDKYDTKSIEGYKVFRLLSTSKAANNTLKFSLKDTDDTELVSVNSTIRTIDDIQIDITPRGGPIKVGEEVYDFDIALKDAGGTPLTEFDSRAYLVINPIYGSTPNSYVDIVNGKATMELQTSTVAGKDIKLEFQVEGMNRIVQEYIDILPDVAIKLDLSLSRDKIEANPDDSAYLYGVLKDRYGNEVFNDSTTEFSLEIPQAYKSVITSSSSSQTVKQGKAQFKLSGTDIPGIGYFKVATSPSLDDNSFELQGQAPFEKSKLTIPTFTTESGLSETGRLFFQEYNSATYITRFSTQYRLEQSDAYRELPSVLQARVISLWQETNKLVIHGVGENAGSLETFYFWNDEHIQGSKYNGTYSVLLGAPYGDVNQENYLGGSLLFDTNNRSLAVTSLLNTPYKYDDILRISEKGNIRNIQSGGDITQDIRLRPDFDQDDKMYVDIFNDALGTYVGKIYYNLGDVELKECDTDPVSCLEKDQTSLSIDMVDSDYSIAPRGNDLVVKNNFGTDALIFRQDGTIERKSNLYIEIDENHQGEHLKMMLKSGDQTVGDMALQIVNGTVNITRDEALLQTKLETLENSIITYVKTNQYGSRDVAEKNGGTQKILFYNDPFGSRTRLDTFHSGQEQGFENASEEKGLGWEYSNKSLLSFASGESVGESTRQYHSFSLINLGDPVVSMKQIRRNFINAPSLQKSFDPSVGRKISDSDDVIGYDVFDYNNDEKDDLVFIKSDGYIELLENKDVSGDFLKKGNLVYAVDGGPTRLIKTGDFTGDGYDDIFFVSEDGEPVLFNNHQKDFLRTSLTEQLTLSGTIIQAEVYDMDNDTRSDLVTLDDAGQIHIFYGGGTPASPSFTKLMVGDGYGIKLSDTLMSRGGAVYFDELPQIPDDGNYTGLITDSEQLNQEIQSAIAAGEDTPEPEFFNEFLADRLLFIKLPYVPYDVSTRDYTDQELLELALDQGIDTSNYAEFDAFLDEAKTSLKTFVEENSSYVNYNSSYGKSQSTSFLRSEYADSQGLEIEKKFIDISPEFLQTGDLVDVEIRLKNTSNATLNNIAFVDIIPRNFVIESEEITIISQGGGSLTPKPGLGMFDMLIDGFFLAPAEEIVFQYTLKTLPLKYGYIQVGLFEEGELGDDDFGDIILKPDHLNCGEEADIYTSIATRAYTKGKTTPRCDEEKLALPDELGKNSLDNNNNGVPDYIDALVGGPDEDVLDYAQGVLNEMNTDSDNDGIPDIDDAIPSIDEESTDFMSAIAGINETVDEISEEIDTIIEGFSCGFGGGSCIATPLNWAPLAPGGDPTLFGMPVGDGLKVNEGIPVFSALTGLQMTCGHSPCCIPTVYPVSSKGFVPGPRCGPNSAGGSKGTWAPTNYVRLFATPTLTGGAGIAACFGGPAIVKGNIPPPGVSPIAPGGNCVVAAVPLLGCEGEEGDPRVTGLPWEYPDYGVIHANCPSGVKDKKTLPPEIDKEFVDEYLQYKETGNKTPSLVEKFKDAFTEVAKGGGNWNMPSGPLINIGGGGDVDMGLSVDFDASALSSGSFQDVIKVQNTRIAPFPDFLMDWVTRQLEEVVTKLTNLPKIFVILPDFSGIFDYGWEDFNENLTDSFEEGKASDAQKKANIQSKIDSLRGQKDALGNCDGANKSTCRIMDLQISQLNAQKSFASPETLSGIKSAYEFLGNVPMVKVEPETINVNIPWADAATLERATLDWRLALDQWKGEVARALGQWNLADDDVRNEKLLLDANALVSSLERNLEIIEEYKDFPEKLNKLISIKEVRLEQILCNIEAISGFLGEWISTNGERFKAWVELYVLIKSILKSWQLLIDVFKGYDEECHQCKNERQDLQSFIWKLISSVMPKLPIIQFPKWPDIVLDLHNVRAGMTLYLPDFQINLRPIVLPTLPNLKLPDSPNASLTLPELPILPTFELPELPDLPSLPTVELPDLPPPPKIPKLFGAVEGILNIMKLVTKVMCILKQSPFVPEWRAGDQIAYITERGGYLPTDFIDISLPQFSYPFVDAITVTTYVNFEFETEFILEAVRQITAPLDTFTNDIVNMFKIQVPDVDFSGAIPTDIDVDVEIDGGVDVNGIPLEDLSSMKGTQQGFELIALMFAAKMQDLFTYVASQKDVTLSNDEFIAYVNENLASDSVSKNPRMNEIRELWEDVNNMTYSKEDTLIEALLENKDQKFAELGNILTTEIQESKQLKEKLKNLGSPSYITKTTALSNSNADTYNTRLESYNDKLVESAITLIEGDTENAAYEKDVAERGTEITREIRGGLTAFSDGLLASHEGGAAHSDGGVNSCSYSGDSYKYTYEGIYVLEYDRHYRLFEYLDELVGDEHTTPIDVDGDQDDDLIYMVDGEVFLKENLKNKDIKTYVSLPPLILNSSDNTFYNGDVYYEAVNGFEEANISDSFINVRFKAPTDTQVDNFRMEYYTIVDKFRNLGDENYTPSGVQKTVVDAFSDIEENILQGTNQNYTLGKNLAYLKSAGVIAGAKLTNTKLINIREDLASNNIVTLTSDSELYAGKNSFQIQYYTTDPEDIQELTIQKHTYVSFPGLTYVVGLSGDAYVASSILEDVEGAGIVQYVGKPLLPGATIVYEGNGTALSESSHIDIGYYDGSEVELHMSEVSHYRLYDLGTNDDEHLIRLKVENDFYYAKIYAFKDGLKSTDSRQILLSPQTQADTEPPQIGLNQKIRIPVYQKKVFDFTPYIYEDSGIDNIVDVQIDFDFSEDSDNDGNARNDRDTENMSIIQTPTKIAVEFGEYEKLFTRQIRLSLTDGNGNTGYKDIDFEVYPPAPQIQSYQDATIGGVIDETLLDEPVRIYRVRGGAIKKLENSEGTDIVDTTSTGSYAFGVPDTTSGLLLEKDGQEVASINEYTGTIELKSPLASVEVLASNDTNNTDGFPRIAVNYLGEELFYEYIQPKVDQDIDIIQLTSEVTGEGIYVRIIDQDIYNSFKVPLGVRFNPGAVILYLNADEDKDAVFSVFRDGRIYSGDTSRYTLKYQALGERSTYILYDTQTQTDIAQVILDIEASYILK